MPRRAEAPALIVMQRSLCFCGCDGFGAGGSLAVPELRFSLPFARFDRERAWTSEFITDVIEILKIFLTGMEMWLIYKLAQSNEVLKCSISKFYAMYGVMNLMF